MKKTVFLIVLLLVPIICISTVHAQNYWIGSVYMGTDGWYSNVLNFDWAASGSGLAQGIKPGQTLIVGDKITFRYQSFLVGISNPDGISLGPFPSLNSTYEYTVVAEFTEEVVGFNSVSITGGFIQTIYLVPVDGTAYMYFDPNKNADVTAGIGFDDGIQVMKGTVKGGLNTFTYNTVEGKGGGGTSPAIEFYVDPVEIDENYIKPKEFIGGLRFEGTLNYPPLDSETAVFFEGRAGEGNYNTYSVTVNDMLLKVDGSTKNTLKPCIDLVKEVSPDGSAWYDANASDCTDAPITGDLAEYRLTIKNCGPETLTNIVISDPVLGISGYNVGNNLPAGGEIVLTSADIDQLYNPNLCPIDPNNPNVVDGGLRNIARVDAVGVTSGIPVLDEDPACIRCKEAIGGCRMTGGHVKFYDDGTSLTVPGDAETYNVSQVMVKKGNKLQSENQVTWYTLGGQIGAPQAGCLAAPDPKQPFGNWQHTHHQGSVSWPGGSFSGGFSFHSGTASAPDEAYIKCITCADPGWCVQARCAPFKQIFWEGTGVFHNIDAGTNFNGCEVKTPGKNKPPTIHYYRAHVGDFGEPAGSSEQQKPADQCGWTSAGVSIWNGILDGVTVLPWPLDFKFGDKGGQSCSSFEGCNLPPYNGKCGECPDWYEIEIHCTADPTSPIIYKVGNFITHGNHQIHPEVGQQCPY
jgi:hypothetical protein